MDVTIIGNGLQSNIEAQVDATRQALRVSLNPLEYNFSGIQGGHFNLGTTTGAISAIAAVGQIFAVRWNDQSKLMVLLRLAVSSTCTAFSSGTGADLEAVRASSYTANASGGTAITPSTTSQMARQTTMAPSSFNSLGEIRVSTTAALTAGTQTLDTAGFGATQLGGIAGYASPLIELFNCFVNGQHPIILANNMGFVVRAVTTVPASNTFRYSVQMSWIEVSSF